MNTNQQIEKLSNRELALAIILGSLPTVITARVYGYESLISFIQAQNLTPAMLGYYVLLLMLYPSLWLAEQMLVRYVPDTGPDHVLTKLRQFSVPLHGTLVSALRVMSGASLIMCLPVLIIQPNSFHLALASLGLLFGAGGVMTCCLLTGAGVFQDALLSPAGDR